MKALINAAIYDFDEYGSNQYILFDSEIIEVGDMDEFKGAEEIFDCRGSLVLPGLINGHTHVYSTLSRGMSVPFNPKNFRDILDQLWWKLDRQLDLNSIYYSGLSYGIDCIKNGVTSIIDHHASGLSIKGSLDTLKRAICEELGLRGIFCFETSDRFDLQSCIEENMDFLKNKSEHSAGLFGMHASMSLSNQSLQEIAKLCVEDPIHIHVAESRDDIEDCYEKYGCGVVERLNKFGLLRKDSILAHCVHITQEEAELISEKGCFVALNTTSNMNNSVGLPNYEMLREKRVKCIPGNDGLGASITRDYTNLAYTMKYKSGNPTSFGIDDMLQVIRNGYEYIGQALNISIGKLKAGYRADFIKVPYTPPTPLNQSNISSHIFFGVFDNLHPRDVWASGKQLLKDYELLLDEERIFSRASEEAYRLWERIEKN